MKYISTILSTTIIFAFLLTTCTKDKNSNINLLEPVHINISEDLNNNTELTHLISSTERDINKISNSIEALILDNENIFINYSANSEQNKKAKNNFWVSFASSNTQLSIAIDKFNEEITRAQKHSIISHKQFYSLIKISDTFENRILQLESKYSEIYSIKY